MLVAGVAAYRAWRAEGGAAPAVVAGHSLGEYSALVASGVLTLAQAAPLVRFRAQAMQDAVPVGTGAMAAILGMEARKVIEGCAEAVRSFGANTDEVVEAVNFNDPAQTVIAGSKAAVEKACEVLKANGAKRALPLPVSAPVPFEPDEAGGREAAGKSWRPRRSQRRRFRWSTTSRSRSKPSPDRIRAALYEQAFGPVRWVEMRAGHQGARHHDHRRVRPGQGAGRTCAKRIDAELTRHRAVRPRHAGRSERAAGMSSQF